MNGKALSLAHSIKLFFTSWSDAVTAAWKIVKMQAGIATPVTFAKSEGEVREATVIAIGSLSTLDKGFVRFVENTDNGGTQWRSFRLDRMIFAA